MHIYNYESNGTVVKSDARANERVHIYHGMRCTTDSQGAFRSRPSNYELFISRHVLKTKGDFKLFEIAVTSLEANVLARAVDQHARFEVTIRKQVGPKKVPIQQVELKRVQPVLWSLEWDGEGNDGLHGATFVESLNVLATAGTITNLVDNSPVAFNLE